MPARLVLLPSDDEYTASRIYDEYIISHEDSHAFRLTQEWYPIALEIDGVRVPFTRKERVQFTIFDERDAEVGVSRLARYVSPAPWKNGVHYFRGVEWRGVGQYRLSFCARDVRDGVDVEGLEFIVRVRDPEYESAMEAAALAEFEVALEKHAQRVEAAVDYPRRPLTRAELNWLERTAGALRGTGPPAQRVFEIAAEMRRALGAPAEKALAVLEPFFETAAGRTRRLEMEREKKRLLVGSSLFAGASRGDGVGSKGPVNAETKRKLLDSLVSQYFGGMGDRDMTETTARVGAGAGAGAAIGGPGGLSPWTPHRRKPRMPVQLADRANYAAAFATAREWAAARLRERSDLLDNATEARRARAAGLPDASIRAIHARRSPGPAPRDIIRRGTLRVHRHEPLAAQSTLVLALPRARVIALTLFRAVMCRSSSTWLARAEALATRRAEAAVAEYNAAETRAVKARRERSGGGRWSASDEEAAVAAFQRKAGPRPTLLASATPSAVDAAFLDAGSGVEGKTLAPAFSPPLFRELRRLLYAERPRGYSAALYDGEQDPEKSRKRRAERPLETMQQDWTAARLPHSRLARGRTRLRSPFFNDAQTTSNVSEWLAAVVGGAGGKGGGALKKIPGSNAWGTGGAPKAQRGSSPRESPRRVGARK